MYVCLQRLFGILHIDNKMKLDDLPKSLIMRKWWSYMSDLMVTNEDKSPWSVPIKEVFHMD